MDPENCLVFPWGHVFSDWEWGPLLNGKCSCPVMLHSLRNISLELCGIIIIFSFGRAGWLRSEFCAGWIITSSINSMTDPLFPSISIPVLFQQTNPQTDVLNLTSLSQAGARSSWRSHASGLHISSQVWGKEVKPAMQNCSLSQELFELLDV